MYFLMVGDAYALTSVASCGNLGIPNEVYALSTDVSSEGTCFTILADGITLDGKGHTLNYSASVSGIAIDNSDGYGGITIRNMNIIQLNSSVGGTAIYGKNMKNSTIINNSISASKSGTGIFLLVSASNVLFNNKIQGGFRGIRLAISNNDYISNNAVEAYFSAIDVSLANASVISNNKFVVEDTGSVIGMSFSGSNKSTVSNNELMVMGNGGYAIIYVGSDNYKAYGHARHSNDDNVFSNNNVNIIMRGNKVIDAIERLSDANNVFSNNKISIMVQPEPLQPFKIFIVLLAVALPLFWISNTRKKIMERMFGRK